MRELAATGKTPANAGPAGRQPAPEPAPESDTRAGFDFAGLRIHGTAVAVPDDQLEVEAHAAADRIAGPRPHPRGGAQPSTSDVDTAAVPGAGRPLDALTRKRFESEFGADLSRIRVHADDAAADSARRIGAAAYTLGSHIVFGRDNFEPATDSGRWLLAHELAHTVQDDAAVVHRAPEDVPRLEKEFDEGIAAADSAGYRKAVEALNAFADFDIKRLISSSPGKGRKPLVAGQIASLHSAALDSPKLGPNSQAAILTRPAYLQLNFQNEANRGRWTAAAEYLNGLNEPDMMARMRQLTMDQLKDLQVGALTNPRLGKDSGVALNVDKAIKIARQALIDAAVAVATPPTSNIGTGPPGTLATITVTGGTGNPNIGIPAADREPLPQGTDGKADPSYIDKDIVNFHYNVLTGLFEIQYTGGGFIQLDLDTVLKAAKAGSPAVTGVEYFRHKQNKRVYPANFNRRELPTICAGALEVEKHIPEAQARTIGAMIDVAVSAQGVAAATLRVGQATQGSSGGGKPAAKKQPAKETDSAASGSGAGAKPGGGTVNEPPSGMSASGQGAKPGATPKSGGQSGGGQVQQVPAGRRPSGPPPEGLPSEIQWRSGPFKGPFSNGFSSTVAQGTAKVGSQALGEAVLVKALPGAQVTGALTTVADDVVQVAGTSIGKALVVTGGKFIPSAVANTGRAVLYALVFQDTTYLIVSPAQGTDQPAQAPGKDTGAANAPGKDSTTVKAPGQDTGTKVIDPTPTNPIVAPPGPMVDEPAECKKQIGAKSPHYHHIFPQTFRQRFTDLNIDIDKWTVRMGWQEHIGKNGVHASFGWNDEWSVFFDDVPELGKMTKQQAEGWQLRAYNLGFRLMVEAGIDRRKLVPYPK